MSEVNIIINNCIRYTESGYTLADGGNLLINELANKGVEVRLIGLIKVLEDSNTNSFLSSKVLLSSLTFNLKHNNLIIKPLNYIHAFFKLMLLCFLGKNFYVYAPSNISILSLFFLRLFRKKYGMYVRGNIQQSRMAGKVRNSKLMSDFYIKAVKQAEFVLVTGKSLYHKIVQLNIKTELVVPMIPYNANDLFKRDFLKNDQFVLLFVGRIDKEKGIEEIIDAITLLRLTTNKKFKVKLIGGGEDSYIDTLKQKIEQNNIFDYVDFCGRINDTKELKESYIKADIFVFPSHHEGFPRVLYEAMSFSLPIVTTNLETYEGIMENDVNSLMVDVNSPGQIASAINQLFNSKKKREMLGRAGLKYMQDFYKSNESKSHATQVIEMLNLINNDIK